jgi:Transcription factor WhiB
VTLYLNSRFFSAMRKGSSWMKDALCAKPEYRDLPWFFSDKLGKTTQKKHRQHLKQVCNACPVQAECAHFANKAGVNAGVWAGRYYGG